MRNQSMTSLVQKLIRRQIAGSTRIAAGKKPFRFHEKCPENLQIPLKKILHRDVLLRGHVAIGFTDNGKYFMTYVCNIKFQLTESSACSYKYTLFWWRFNLWRPLKKMHEVELFPNENIPNEIHLMICQPPRSKFIVVHGSTLSVDSQSSGKMCYVSVVPKFSSSVEYALHWKYELLPPYPPFVSSISLKLPNVILLNSADMMFAIFIDADNLSMTKHKRRCRTSSLQCYCEYKRLLDSNRNQTASDISIIDHDTDETEVRDHDTNEAEVTDHDTIEAEVTDHDTNEAEVIDYDENETEVLEHDENDTNVISQHANEANVMVFDVNEAEVIDHDTNEAEVTDHDTNEAELIDNDTNEANGHDIECVSFIRQGFSFPNEIGTVDSLPDSPFDCTATVIPCYMTSLDGSITLKHAYEHRCFRTFYKGCLDSCEHFISQVQFDAENFINEELQKCESISRRFVSLRDYDMQFVDVCESTNDVIILMNALIVLRDVSGKNVDAPNTSLSALKGHEISRLVLYTAGYLLSWSVYNGKVKVLQTFPLKEKPGNICKSRQFSPSLTQTVQLRKQWFVPSQKHTSVQTLSNHSVFTGKSLQFLVHPEFPVAVVL